MKERSTLAEVPRELDVIGIAFAGRTRYSEGNALEGLVLWLVKNTCKESGNKEGLAMLEATTLQAAELLDILPEEDVALVNALIKKLVIAWDPNFTKVSAKEKELLVESDSEMKNGDFISEEDFWS